MEAPRLDIKDEVVTEMCGISALHFGANRISFGASARIYHPLPVNLSTLNRDTDHTNQPLGKLRFVACGMKRHADAASDQSTSQCRFFFCYRPTFAPSLSINLLS